MARVCSGTFALLFSLAAFCCIIAAIALPQWVRTTIGYSTTASVNSVTSNVHVEYQATFGLIYRKSRLSYTVDGTPGLPSRDPVFVYKDCGAADSNTVECKKLYRSGIACVVLSAVAALFSLIGFFLSCAFFSAKTSRGVFKAFVTFVVMAAILVAATIVVFAALAYPEIKEKNSNFFGGAEAKIAAVNEALNTSLDITPAADTAKQVIPWVSGVLALVSIVCLVISSIIGCAVLSRTKQAADPYRPTRFA
eukprot:tig00020610_g11982.t1